MVVGLLCGCTSKFQGTWCKYSDVATSLVVLDENVSDSDINEIINYIQTIKNLKSYDIIDKIEEASKMITIYYKDEENIEEYQEKLKTYNGVSYIKYNRLNTVLDKLVIKKDSYVFDTSLNSLSASELSGKYEIEKNTLTLDNGTKFYYKNKFLCYDYNCNDILTKAKGNECNS